jgi:hypothetical protein
MKKMLSIVLMLFLSTGIFAQTIGINSDENERRRNELKRLGIEPTQRNGDVTQGKAQVRPDNYSALIANRIKARIYYKISCNETKHTVRITIEQNSTGEILSVNIIEASKSERWDTAVRKAVYASSPLPVFEGGRAVPRVLELTVTNLSEQEKNMMSGCAPEQ